MIELGTSSTDTKQWAVFLMDARGVLIGFGRADSRVECRTIIKTHKAQRKESGPMTDSVGPYTYFIGRPFQG